MWTNKLQWLFKQSKIFIVYGPIKFRGHLSGPNWRSKPLSRVLTEHSRWMMNKRMRCCILWTIFCVALKHSARTNSEQVLHLFLKLSAKKFLLADEDHKMFKSPGMTSNLTKFLELSKETEDVITQIFLSKWNVHREKKCAKTKDVYCESKQEFQKHEPRENLNIGQCWRCAHQCSVCSCVDKGLIWR